MLGTAPNSSQFCFVPTVPSPTVEGTGLCREWGTPPLPWPAPWGLSLAAGWRVRRLSDAAALTLAACSWAELFCELHTRWGPEFCGCWVTVDLNRGCMEPKYGTEAFLTSPLPGIHRVKEKHCFPILCPRRKPPERSTLLLRGRHHT